jgi:flagellar basal body L-ring protein FlgH
MKRRAGRLAGLTLPLALGCSPTQTQSAADRQRDQRAGTHAPATISSHELWQESQASWLAELRASHSNHIGEPVRIRIDESTERLVASNAALDAPRWFGLAQALQRSHPQLGLADLLALLRATSSVGRSEPEIDVQIKRLFPDGALFVEGTRVVKTAGDELHIYVSGIVQPGDLARDNSVRSSVVNDAEVEVVARGSHKADQSAAPPWLVQLLQLAEAR